jgi:hypothetical protein
LKRKKNEYRILRVFFKYEGKSYLLEIGNNLAQVKDLYFVIRSFTVAVLIGLVLLTFLFEAFLLITCYGRFTVLSTENQVY